MEKKLIEKLIAIQSCIKAPKTQFNSFGKYKYRNCEDILEAVKPLLSKNGLALILTDEIVSVGDRIYVKATATITDGDNSISNSAFAREEESKKGQDGSQVTGTSSSYARKYALNGMFCIDDTKDSDTTNTGDKPEKDDNYNLAIQEVKGAQSLTELTRIYNTYTMLQSNKEFVSKLSEKRKTLENAK
jgi:hypothetical protein